MIDLGPMEFTRQDRVHCLKVGSVEHNEICRDCIFYRGCTQKMRHEMREQNIRDLETLGNYEIVNCKNCKYFEYDSIAKVDGIPLIVAHEICTKWGKGCKTNENGFCFLGEPREERNGKDDRGSNKNV